MTISNRSLCVRSVVPPMAALGLLGTVFAACSSDSTSPHTIPAPQSGDASTAADSGDASTRADSSVDHAAATPSTTFEPQLPPAINTLTPKPNVLAATKAQADVVTVKDDSLEFPLESAADVLAWEQGRIVASAPGTGTGYNPFGFARRVVSITQSNGKIIVLTERVGIASLVDGELRFRGDMGGVPVDLSKVDVAWVAKNLYKTFDPFASQPAGIGHLRNNWIVRPLPGGGPGQPSWFGDAIDALYDVGQSVYEACSDGVCTIYNTVADFARSLMPPYSGSIDISPNMSLPKMVIPIVQDLNVQRTITTKKGVELKLFLRGNVNVNAQVETLNPAFTFGFKTGNALTFLSPVAAAMAAEYSVDVHARLKGNVGLEADFEAGIGTDAAGADAGKTLQQQNLDYAANVISAEKKALFGDPAFEPSATFTKTLLQGRPLVQVFMAGPVPVVITETMQLDLACGFEAKASVKTTVDLAVDSSVRFAAKYKDFRPSIETPSFELNPTVSTSVLGSGSIVAHCGLIPRINVFVYDSVGVFVGLRGSMVAEGKYESTCSPNSTAPDGKVSLKVGPNVGVPLGIRVQPPFSSFAGSAVPGYETPTLEAYSHDFGTIYSHEWPVPGIGFCTPLCGNGMRDEGDDPQNPTETDVDCGGECVAQCDRGKRCEENEDCKEPYVCINKVCADNSSAASCANGVRDSDEADIDCGGLCPAKCAVGKHCSQGTDCASQACKAGAWGSGLCVASKCENGVRDVVCDGDNCAESGVDCGGPCPAKCRTGQLGAVAKDCESGFSDGSLCVARACDQDGSCQLCNAGSWDHDNDSATACLEKRACGRNEYYKDPGARDRDRTCAACPPGSIPVTTGEMALRFLTCTPCESGTYPGDAVCLPKGICGAGTFIANPDSTSEQSICTPCAAGTYNRLQDNARSCSPCPAGNYRDHPTSCTPCPAGTWDHDGDSASPCQDWQKCAPGERATPGSTTSNATCTPCAAGTRGVGDNCVACEAGTYSSAGARECTPCAAGTYAAAGASSCTPCAAGTHSERHACVACFAGTYSSAGAAECTMCAAGTFAAVGSSTCTACPTGTWDQDHDPGSPCVDQSTCPAGTFVQAGGSATANRACASCEAGTFSSGPNAASCTACAAGTSAGANATSCTPCAAGTYAAAGAGSCEACSSDTWDHDNNPATACAAKTACSAGTRVDSAGSATANRTCTSCAAGTFSSGPNAASCTACAAGTSAGANATSCTPCAAGTYAAAGAGSCEACSSDTWDHDNNSATACVAKFTCSVGMQIDSPGSATADRTCTPCTAGKFSSGTNAVSCTDCSAGTYSGAPGAASCSACTAGTYAPAGSSTCTECLSESWDHDSNPATACAERAACAAGTRVDNPGSATVNRTCADCSAGTYSSLLNVPSCEACPPGTYAAAKSATCATCPAGTADHDEDPATPCLATDGLVLVHQFGTASADTAYSVSADVVGNVYTVGSTGGALGGPMSGAVDAFVHKITTAGTEVWTKQFGGGSTTHTYANSVKASLDGSVYVVGQTDGALAGKSNSGGIDAFIRAYNSNGDEKWTVQFGTANDDVVRSVAVDSDGGIYVVGYTTGDLGGTSAGGKDGIIRKFDSTGAVLWTRQFGSSGDDDAFSVAADSGGNASHCGQALLQRRQPAQVRQRRDPCLGTERLRCDSQCRGRRLQRQCLRSRGYAVWGRRRNEHHGLQVQPHRECACDHRCVWHRGR